MRRAERAASIAVLPQPIIHTFAPSSTGISLRAMKPSEMSSMRRRKWVARRMRLRSAHLRSSLSLPFCQMGISSDLGLLVPVPMKMASKP